MAYLKPQSPLIMGEDHIYPLTTYDQIINKDGNRVTEVADGKNISYLYRATFTTEGWVGGASPYSQSVTISPLIDGPAITSNSVFSSGPMCEKTTNEDTNRTLQETLNLFNIGYSQLGNGNVTCYLFEKPTNDIEVIWLIKKG